MNLNWYAFVFVVVIGCDLVLTSVNGYEFDDGSDEKIQRSLLRFLKNMAKRDPQSDSKRGCVLNAGLSQGCDLMDLLAARQQSSRFHSFSGPGRRRRSVFSQ